MTELDTIGILCTPGRETALLRSLPPLLRRLPAGGQAAVLVFTLPGVRLGERETDGALVTAQGYMACRNRLPAVVFHVAVQRRRADIRKMRALAELPDVRVLNPSNELSQRAVRGMLLSDPELRPLVPPELPAAEADSLPGFVRRPPAGMSAARLVCGLHAADGTAGGWRLFDGGGAPAGHAADSGTALSLAGPGRCLTLGLSGAFPAGRPAGTRGVVQRGADGAWRVVERAALFDPAGVARPMEPETERTLLAVARRAGSYLPDLALCTVDLLHVPGSAPLFLGLGGWQPGLLGRRTANSVKTNLCRNMLAYSRLILHS